MTRPKLECVACDAEEHTFTRGEAFLSGMALGATHGKAYAEFEERTLCKFHRERFRGLKDMLENRKKARES